MNIAPIDRLKGLIVLSCVLLLAAVGHAQPGSASSRPLPRLNTRRGLYIRADGTRVYKDPAPPRNRVFTYRRKDGSVVRTYTGPRRSYNGASQRAPRHFRRRHLSRKHHMPSRRR